MKCDRCGKEGPDGNGWHRLDHLTRWKLPRMARPKWASMATRRWDLCLSCWTKVNRVLLGFRRP